MKYQSDPYFSLFLYFYTATQAVSTKLADLYSLRENKAFIQRLQQRTKDRARPFMRTAYGLVGTDEWWRNIEKLLKVFDGTVVDKYDAGHGDYPMMCLDSAGASIEFHCEGGADLYAVGDQLRVQYLPYYEIVSGDDRSSVLVVRIQKKIQ